MTDKSLDEMNKLPAEQVSDLFQVFIDDSVTSLAGSMTMDQLRRVIVRALDPNNLGVATLAEALSATSGTVSGESLLRHVLEPDIHAEINDAVAGIRGLYSSEKIEDKQITELIPKTHTHLQATENQSGFLSALAFRKLMNGGFEQNDIITVNGSFSITSLYLGKYVRQRASGATTVTLPAAGSLNADIGSVIWISQMSAGSTAIAGASGVTVNGVTDLDEIGQAVRLVKVASNEWDALPSGGSGGSIGNGGGTGGDGTSAQKAFNVQRFVVSLGANDLTATATAGTDYTAPASTTSAFARVLRAPNAVIAPTTIADVTAMKFQDDAGAVWLDQADITQSIALSRFDTGGALDVTIEIVEYVGVANGPNEFVVRHNEVLTKAGADNDRNHSSSSFAVGNVADCVPIISSGGWCSKSYVNGVLSSIGTGNTSFVPSGANYQVDFTNLVSNNECKASVTVVEWKGANWVTSREQVQNAIPTRWTPAAVNAKSGTGISTPITNTDKTFLVTHVSNAQVISNSSHAATVDLEDASSINFRQSTAGADTGDAIATIYFVQNTQVSAVANNLTIVRGVANAPTGNPNASLAAHAEAIGTVVVDETSINLLGVSKNQNAGNAGAVTGVAIVGNDLSMTVSGHGGEFANIAYEVIQWPEDAV